MIQQKSNSEEIISSTKDSATFFSVLVSSFSTIFIAELGDKTQIATLILSAQSGRPILIFFAAGLALIFTSLLGVIIGRWIANNLPRKRFTFGSGIIMLSLGIYLALQGIFDLFQNQKLM
tara:strand:+ start:254 stop:613 length:360 start_codon:yes stop_codon:yes gene_type:complete